MLTTQAWLSMGSGAIVGLSLGLLGGGGSILAVPLLLYLVGLSDAHVVIGTSALAVGVNAYFNLLPHWRDGHVRWRSAVAFALPGVVGAALGSIMGRRLHGSALLFLFALLMIFIALLMVRRGTGEPEKRPARPAGRVRKEGLLPAGAAGLLAGGLSGFFGIGGGFLIVPALVISTGMSFINAIGSSLFAVGTFGLTTAVSYATAGLINWPVFIEFIIGGALGGILGARLATYLSGRRATLNYLFAGVVMVVAFYMLYKNAVALHFL